MSLDANLRHVAGVTIFDLNGRLIAGAEADAIRNLVLDGFESGEHWILLNFEEIGHVDSAGLGELVSTYAELVRRGGTLRLLNISDRLAHLLSRTQLDQLFDICEDESAALTTFNSAENARTQRKLAGYLDRNP